MATKFSPYSSSSTTFSTCSLKHDTVVAANLKSFILSTTTSKTLISKWVFKIQSRIGSRSHFQLNSSNGYPLKSVSWQKDAYYRKERQRPTASNQRTRFQPVNQPSEAEPSEDELYQAESSQPKIEGHEQLELSAGRPSSPPLLHSYVKHVAAALSVGQERGVLKCVHHTHKLHKWSVKPDATSALWKELVKKSKLDGLRTCSYREIESSLISAFVERWHAETNSFHLPFGEMTITLDDVYCITQLPVIGRPVVCDETTESYHERVAYMMELLGVSEDEANQSFVHADAARKGGYIKLDWLRENFEDKCASEDPAICVYAVRAYLLYSLGCTIFCAKSSYGVPAYWLKFLRNVESVGTYAWGTASLAYLYKQLGLASERTCKSAAGHLALLEAWIFEHFPMFVNEKNPTYNSKLPRAMMWVPRFRKSLNLLQSARERIKSLRPDEVNWTPYENVRDIFQFQRIALYHGCIAAGRVFEPYNPDRVLRQFGRIQTIPGNPVGHQYRNRYLKENQKYLKALAQYFSVWESHVLSEEQLGNFAVPSYQVACNYMDWYNNMHSHPLAQSPENLPKVYVEPRNVGPWEQLSQILINSRNWRQRHGDDSIPHTEALNAIDFACDTLFANAPYHDGPSSSAGPWEQLSQILINLRNQRQRHGDDSIQHIEALNAIDFACDTLLP